MKLFLLIACHICALTLKAQTTFPSQLEKNDIIFMREEEKLARDVYDSLYVLWGLRPFENIRSSEQNHMNQMKSLIAQFKLVDPVGITKDKPGVFQNTLFTKYYADLLASGKKSEIEALRVGAKIEEIDIKDLIEKSKNTKDTIILEVYENLLSASERHLRAFNRNLKMRGINYEPMVLSKELFEKIISE